MEKQCSKDHYELVADLEVRVTASQIPVCSTRPKEPQVIPQSVVITPSNLSKTSYTNTTQVGVHTIIRQ